VKYIALLRGINVGGHRKVPMTQLRDLLTSLGHDEVVTYIQSGNAIFSSARTGEAALTGEIEARIEHDFGFPVTVVLRTPQELAAVVAGNPFLASTENLAQLYVAFLSAQPGEDRAAALHAEPYVPDEFAIGDRAVYLRYVSGAGRTKLTNDVLERQLGVRSTARNWNTVTRLLEMAGE
jgi:uncharacterized protein (DUF1697 family)